MHGLSKDEIISSGESAVSQGITDSSSVLVQLAVGIYRIIQIFLTGWALIKLTVLGIKYFTTSTLLPPQELKSLRARILNHLIVTFVIIGAETIIEILSNVLISWGTTD